MSQLAHVTLFGAVALQDGDRTVRTFRTKRTQVLLAYLAVHLGKRVSREALVDALWPEVDEAAGRNRLSTELSFLRSVFQSPDRSADEFIVADRSAVCLRSQAVTTDLNEFWASMKKARDRNQRISARVASHRHALELHKAPLLADLYEEWVFAEQARVSETITATTLELGTILGELRGNGAAIPLLQSAIDIEPTSELLNAALLNAYQQTGRNDEARAAFRRYETIAEAELGVAPPDEWASLIATKPKQAHVHRVDSIWQGNRGKSSFVGRSRELDQLTSLVSSPHPCQLVTIVGLGGIGKSRLAEAVSLAEIAEGRDVVGVDLTKVSNRQEMLSEIVRRSGGSSASPDSDRAAALLVDRTALLVLDNFEHLDHTCALAVSELLALAEDLKVLVTSRVALQVDGEHVFRLESLPLPGSESPEASPAIQLFLERAKRVRPDFGGLLELNVIRQICIRLEGVPLSIELAASRLNVLNLDQIAVELNDPLSLLQTPRSDARHGTLRSVLEWSYRNLTDDAKKMFRMSAVFHGGFDYGAAKHVWGGQSCFDILDELISASLLTSRETEFVMRYGFLEVIRELAEELASPEEAELAAQRRSEHFLSLGRRHDFDLRNANCIESLNRLVPDSSNLLATLRDFGASDSGFELVGALQPFWCYRELSAEVWALYSRQEIESASRSKSWARAVLTLQLCAGQINEFASSAYLKHLLTNEVPRLLEPNDLAQAANVLNSLEVVKESGLTSADVEFQDYSGFARCLLFGEYARSLFYKGRCVEGLQSALKALACGRESGCPWLIMEALDRVTWFAHNCSRFALATSSLAEHSAISMAVRGHSATTPNQFEGQLEFAAGRLDLASQAFERLGAWAARIRRPLAVAAAYAGLARTALFNEQFEEAFRFETRALNERTTVGEGEFTSYSFRGFSAIALAKGNPEEGLTLISHCLDLLRPSSSEGALLRTNFEKGRCLVALNRLDEGAPLLRSCLETWTRYGAAWFVGECLIACAVCEAARSEFEQAARILGCSTRIREELGVPLLPLQLTTVRKVRDQIEAAFGENRTLALIELGKSLDPLATFAG